MCSVVLELRATLPHVRAFKVRARSIQHVMSLFQVTPSATSESCFKTPDYHKAAVTDVNAGKHRLRRLRDETARGAISKAKVDCLSWPKGHLITESLMCMRKLTDMASKYKLVAHGYILEKTLNRKPYSRVSLAPIHSIHRYIDVVFDEVTLILPCKPQYICCAAQSQCSMPCGDSVIPRLLYLRRCSQLLATGEHARRCAVFWKS